MNLANIAATLIMVCPVWRVTAHQLFAKTMMAGVGNLPEFRRSGSGWSHALGMLELTDSY
jgi:hypothetical protein